MDPKVVQAVVAPAFLLVGLSHLLQPRLWVRFFEVVRQGGVGAFVIGALLTWQAWRLS